MNQVNKFFLYLQEKNWRAVLLLFLVTFSVHSPVLFNGYNLDDELVTRNHRLTSKGISAIPEIYSSPYYEDDMGYSYGYRPTVLASFAIEHELFGESPFMGHLINLLLYAITVAVLFKLVLLLFPGQWWLAFGTALLFSVHPIHTEVVASLKNRDELLSGLFAVFGLVLTIEKKAKTLSIILLLLFGFLSITSKFSGIYLFLWVPLIFKQQKIHFIPRYIYYLGFFGVVFLTFMMRQAGKELNTYPFLLLGLFVLLDGLSKVIFWQKTSVYFKSIWSEIRGAILAFFRGIRTISLKIHKSVSGFLDSISDPMVNSLTFLHSFISEVSSKAISNAFKSHSIIGIDLPVLKFLLIVLIATWNPLVVIGFTMLPIIWGKLSESQRKFAEDFRIPALSLSVLITSTNLFSPMLMCFFFGKRMLSNKNYSFSKQLIGYGIWAMLAFTDMFLIGDTTDYSDYILLSSLIGLFLLQLVAASMLKSTSTSSKALSYYPAVFLLFIAIFFLENTSGRSETLAIFGFANFLIHLGFLSTKLPTLRFNHTALKLAAIVGLIYLSSTVLISTLSWKEHRESLDFKERWESQRTTLETNSASRLIRAFFMVKVHSTEIMSNVSFKLEGKAIDLKQFQTPVELSSLLRTAAEVSNEEDKMATETNHRPLDWVENPIAFVSDPSIKVSSAIVNTAWIIKKSILPYQQSFYYGYDEVPIPNLLHRVTILSTIGLLLFLLIIAIAFYRYESYAFVMGSFFAFGGALMFSGLVEELPGVIADRFVYISSLGASLALTGLFISGYRKFQNSNTIKNALFAIGFSIFSISITTILCRSMDWKDKVKLMSTDVKKVPNSAQANNLLAHALMEQVFDKKNNKSESEKEQQIIEAENHFEEATEIYPLFFNAWVDKGKVNELLNKPEAAIESFKTALSIDSSYTPLINWIGKNFELLGKYDRAAKYYESYLRLHPNDFVNYDNLARVLFRQNKFDEAIRVCEDYLQIDPSNQIFIDNIAFMKQHMENAKTLESNTE